MKDNAMLQTFKQFFASQDPVTALLANGLNVNTLRANTTLLRKDEWKLLDGAVAGVIRERLVGVADLLSRGLIRNLGGLGVLTVEWERMNDMNDAELDMSGVAPGREDTVSFDIDGVPIPVIHKDYRLDIRRLEASRRSGAALDTIQASIAARKVADKMEDVLFQGHALSSDGYKLYGYTTYPSRNTVNIVDWSSASAADVVNDVLHMVDVQFQNGFYGPYTLYLPKNYWMPLMEDYDTYKEGTLMSRIMQIPNVGQIKVAPKLHDNEVLLVQLTSDVVDWCMGQDITNVPWNSQGGLVQHMKVMCCGAPRMKRQKHENGNLVCGFVHGFEAGTSTTTTTG